LRPAQHVLQLLDARLLMSLLLAGGVVAAVLLEVALVASSSDPRDDLSAAVGGQMLQFGLELVVSVLGQPDRFGGVFSHRDSLGDPGNFRGRRSRRDGPPSGILSGQRRSGSTTWRGDPWRT